jgi:hypothetical protein
MPVVSASAEAMPAGGATEVRVAGAVFVVFTIAGGGAVVAVADVVVDVVVEVAGSFFGHAKRPAARRRMIAVDL